MMHSRLESRVKNFFEVLLVLVAGALGSGYPMRDLRVFPARFGAEPKWYREAKGGEGNHKS
jgi:hypothetical protein